MADEGAEAQVIDDAKPKEKGNSLVLVLMVMSVLMMVLTPAVVFVAFYQFKPETPDVEKKKETFEIQLPTITVNIAGTNASRYAEVDVCVLITNKDMQQTFEKYSDQNSKGKLNLIVARISDIIGAKTLGELTSPDGRTKLQGEISNAITEIEPKVEVLNVYFPRFLIQ